MIGRCAANQGTVLRCRNQNESLAVDGQVPVFHRFLFSTSASIVLILVDILTVADSFNHDTVAVWPEHDPVDAGANTKRRSHFVPQGLGPGITMQRR